MFIGQSNNRTLQYNSQIHTNVITGKGSSTADINNYISKTNKPWTIKLRVHYIRITHRSPLEQNYKTFFEFSRAMCLLISSWSKLQVFVPKHWIAGNVGGSWRYFFVELWHQHCLSCHFLKKYMILMDITLPESTQIGHQSHHQTPSYSSLFCHCKQVVLVYKCFS